VKPQDKTTEDLIREIKRELNVEENFRELFERYYPKIYRFFNHRKGFSSEESCELAQDTFLSVYKGVKGFRQESPFENWLFSIAVNIWRSEIRRIRTRISLVPIDPEEPSETGNHSPPSESFADPAADQLSHTIETEELQTLHKEIRQLPERMRLCIELHIIYDLSYKEIAGLMGISINAVKAHLHQAKKKLGERLKSYFDDDDDEI
jgi:RNA polymerase sigma-70 factor, ECF subfamily